MAKNLCCGLIDCYDLMYRKIDRYPTLDHKRLLNFIYDSEPNKIGQFFIFNYCNDN